MNEGKLDLILEKLNSLDERMKAMGEQMRAMNERLQIVEDRLCRLERDYKVIEDRLYRIERDYRDLRWTIEDIEHKLNVEHKLRRLESESKRGESLFRDIRVPAPALGGIRGPEVDITGENLR